MNILGLDVQVPVCQHYFLMFCLFVFLSISVLLLANFIFQTSNSTGFIFMVFTKLTFLSLVDALLVSLTTHLNLSAFHKSMTYTI